MTVVGYSFDKERRSITIRVNESFKEETIIFLVNNGILNLATLADVKTIDNNKLFIRLKCPSNENFKELFELLHKEMQI